MIGFNLVCRTLVHTALGFQPFPAKPMYRFGAWVALVICQLPCTALRAIQNNLEQACPVEATPTHGDAQCLTVSANSKICFEMGFTEREPECVPTRFVDIFDIFCRGRYYTICTRDVTRGGGNRSLLQSKGL